MKNVEMDIQGAIERAIYWPKNYDPVQDLMIAVRWNINEAIREEAERRPSRS